VADIFISYTSSDSQWAHWIATELNALGHTPHVHELEIEGGAGIYRWMEQRHDAADHVLCVVSDEYMKAPYSTLERHAALWQAAAKRPGFALLVVVKHCSLPTLSDHIRRCELFGVPEEAARIRFRQFMSKREALPVAFPGKVFAVSNIPIRVPKHFMGRDDALAAIETALKRYEGRVAVTALHGLRGVGKTTLAATYAERHRGDYRATWWIRAQTEPTIRADLVALGVQLNWVTADEKEEPALAAVIERLRHEGEGCLLIYDNAVDADALKRYLPLGGRAQVLVTSNAHAWRGIAAPVEIRLWPAEIGAEYLIARSGRAGEGDAALNLSKVLGGLPLAHEQAAAYCEDLGISFAEYRQRFEAATVEYLDQQDYMPPEYHPEEQSDNRDRLTVAGTFRLAIKQAAGRHRGAEPLIVHAALLAPEPIPLSLFSEARKELGDPLASALAGDGFDKAIAALRAFALIDRETIPDERDPSINTDCIRLHRLVREVAASGQGADLDGMRTSLVKALAAIHPRDVFSDPKKWPRMRRLDAVTRGLIDDDDRIPVGTEEQAADMLHEIAAYAHAALGDYVQAERCFKRALAIYERVVGSNDSRTARTLTSLALHLQVEGHHGEALKFSERALAIYEQTCGSEHPDTAWALNSLGRLRRDMGDHERARPLIERALAIREHELGPNHPHTATSIGDLARLLHYQGDYAGELPTL
jgi:tetratricopeptide (TPR) repeat protein